MGKLRFVFVFFIIFFLVIIVKLFYLQVMGGYNGASNGYLNLKQILPQRGLIYDVNNDPLVLNQTEYRLYVEPKKVKDRRGVIDGIDNVLHIGDATLEASIDESKDWVSIQNGVTEEERAQLEKEKLTGIGFEDTSKRFYPEASLAAHLLGFVGKDKDDNNIGYFGVEGYYDKDLSGLNGLLKTERDLFGHTILLGNQENIASQNGRNLVLTIDKSAQKIVKTKLAEGLQKYKAKAGCVIVADPYTLAILAMDCLPDYDPDTYYKFDQAVLNNTSINSLYEPGSTFKPMIMAAAINEKKLKPEDMYDEEGPLKFGEYQIRTWDNNYEKGKISMTRILEKSSNVGMVYVGSKLGNDNIIKYINKYGFGQQTGIDLQGEESGYIRPKSAWYPIDYATATFGQGLAVTPIQMIQAFSSLINGGKLMKPHVVKEIDTDTSKKVVKPVQKAQVISPETSEIMKKMLESTVEHGEYHWAVPDGYRVGGKTGTAQIPLAGHYDASNTIASFIGFAPVEKPRFIAIVVLREPGTSIYGSETAAPLFFEIAKELFVYYNIPPDKQP